MRLYYIVSGTIIILPIINFAVAAPVLVQERLQVGINVVYTPEDAMTMLRGRGNELDEIGLEVLGHPENYFFPKQEDLSAAHPLLNPPPSGPADVPMNFEQPLQEELLPDSGQEYVPPSLGNAWDKLWGDVVEGRFPFPAKPIVEPVPPSLDDKWNMIWRVIVEGRLPAKPESSSVTHPSSSSHWQPPGPAGGSMDVEKQWPSIHDEPLPESSQDHVPLSPGEKWNKIWDDVVEGRFHVTPDVPPSLDDKWNMFWHDIVKGRLPIKPEESSGAYPFSNSHPSEPAGGSMGVEQPRPSIPKEPLQVSSPDRALRTPGDESNKLLNRPLEGHFFSKLKESSTTRPSSGLQQLGPTDGSVDVEPPPPSIPEEHSQVSSSDHAPLSPYGGFNKMWFNLVGSPSPVSSLDHTLLSPSGELSNMWFNLVGHPSPVSSLDHAPPGPGLLTGSRYELMKGDIPPGPSTMPSADHGLMGAQALSNPGLSIESDHEMMDVP